MKEQTIEALAQYVGGRVVGDGKSKVSAVAGLAQAKAGQISFLANPRYTKLLSATRATAVVVSEPVRCPAAQIVVENPYHAFTRIAVLLHGPRACGFSVLNGRAAVDPSAAVGEGTEIHDFVTVSPQARIGRRCVLCPGVTVGVAAEIGDDCVLHPNVVIYDHVRIGNRVVIQAGTAVGGDGFGYATEKGVHHRIPHLGRVVLEDDVALGALCSIQSGALGDTVIGAGTKVGDMVTVGHAVRIGPGCLIVAQSGIAGSTVLGGHCVIAAQVGIAGHLRIGNDVVIAARSGVAGDLADGARVFGSPAFEMQEALKAYSSLASLPEMRKRLKVLEQRVAELEDGRIRSQNH